MRRALAIAVAASLAFAACDAYEPRAFGSTCEHDEDCESGLLCRETTRGAPGACEKGTSLRVCSRDCTTDEACKDLAAPAGAKTLCLGTCEGTPSGKQEVPCHAKADKPWELECPGVCLWAGAR